MRTVSFLHPFGIESASYRYRAMIPAQQIGASINEFADILVVSKPHDNWLIGKAKMEGKIVVADFCDDHFNHPKLGLLYRELASLADFCVAPTEEMRRRIPARKVAVIPDPYEMEEVEPHANGDQLLWFGHNAGIEALQPYHKRPNLTVVTGPKTIPGVVEYSEENLKREMLKANIALFPTMRGHEYKSPNRVINALRMGLYPICDKHPSYKEFREFVWQSDVRTGLKWAGEFKSELNDLVKVGQDFIRDKYSPQTIGAQWADLLGSI